jgi:hypothetical protein
MSLGLGTRAEDVERAAEVTVALVERLRAYARPALGANR